ncbi:putative DNA polymerase zeta catalytic subunit [Fimicolochytrium jonesii]|uniref:putative DNA polymerase zeta catalytic subunit n=1 Tax=Fimicolochytrium jonesii TaxID=1396493 RepID=UPI0022FF36A5|nr:putative DNA polymerase zeta catalytic subunit [Fimicolochytrium jonesii]KAI8818419.1 putative DNA polymerase zeta catalytic subunit [Fimicolochytrium jonesii]
MSRNEIDVAPVISVRIVSVDHYSTFPNPHVDHTTTQFSKPVSRGFRVPVIRIFGVTENGQKACVHLHRVTCHLVRLYIHKFGTSLNHAIALGLGRHPDDAAKCLFIASIALVKGIPYYGFHSRYQPFLKISVLNPSMLNRIVSLVENGSVMGESFQPYEAHLPYLHQFFIDYNLYGMDFIHFADARFRLPIYGAFKLAEACGLQVAANIPPSEIPRNEQTSDSATQLFTDASVLDQRKWPSRFKIERQSYCELEIDTWAEDIMNRSLIDERPRKALIDLQNGTLDLGDTKLVPSLANLWEDERERRRMKGISKAMPAGGTITQASNRLPYQPWGNEERLRRELMASMQQAKGVAGADQMDIPFQEQLGVWEDDAFQTAFQSVPAWKSPQETHQVDTEAEIQKTTIEVYGPTELRRASTQLNDQDLMDLNGLVDEVRVFSPLGDPATDVDESADEGFDDTDEGLANMTLLYDDPLTPASTSSGGVLNSEVSGKVSTSRSTSSNGDTAKRSTKQRSILDAEKVAKFQQFLVNHDISVRSLDKVSNLHPPDAAHRFLSAMNMVSPERNPDRMQEHTALHSWHGRPIADSPSTRHPTPAPTFDLHSDDKFGTPSKSRPLSDVAVPHSHSSQKASENSDDVLETPFASPFTTSANTLPTQQHAEPVVSNAAPGLYQFAFPPPSKDELRATMDLYGIPTVVYREPYFSDPKDVPARVRTFAGRNYKFEADDAQSLSEFDTSGCSVRANVTMTQGGSNKSLARGLEHWQETCRKTRAPSSIRAWTVPFLPPLRAETVKWLKAHEAVKAEVKEQPGPLVLKESMRAFEKGIQERRKPVLVSQIEAPTPKNPYGFKYTQISTKNVSVQKQYMCSMSMELHATCRGDLLPDSQHDEIRALFYCLQHEDETRFRNNGTRPGYFVGIIMVQDEHPLAKTGVGGYAIDIVPDEKALLELLCQKVRFFDPDLLVGYDVHRASWGYAAERARDEHEFDLCAELSRVKPEDANTRFGRDEDAWGANKQSYMHTTGRIFLNVWRLMRSEMNLTSYTLESIAYHVLHIRVPKFTPKTLNEWYEKGMLFRWRTVKYYLSRVQYNLDLLDDTSMISRTSEFARVFGIDFFSVISRGSQYKVESIMARIVKPENFIMASPTKKQVAAQRACECLPLVMEPQSRFYNSPLLVLDFQSLYPSVMIAYNFCYSTCLGRVQNVGKPQKFGILDDYEVPAAFVEAFKDDLNVSPNGMVFVKPHIRESTLRRMLTEILDTRVMVKESMKLYKDDKSLQRILEARQLSLKFIANVTYGYTGASFSGRMPCVEIADAIVQTGRATLERAIDLIHQTKKWGAEVVYGDTDSLFVYLKGKSKDEAFVIGKDIVDTVTKMNPEPVKLKFEKVVYHPCVLLAKKRYVGFKYESPDDVTPEFDAKGIETVRRDNCPAVGKSMEDCLKILFRTQDLSEVKRYLYRQWGKILSGRVSPQDFIIAKEVKYGTYSEHGREPPGADISRRKLKKDPRAEPEYGERVPYVVKYRGPGHLLVDCSVPPEELLNDRTARLHGEYYIRNLIIPSLARVFNLVGADVENWFDKMPKVQRAIQYTASQFRPDAPSNQQDDHKQNNLLGRTIDQYYTAKHCMVCHEMTYQELCTKCAKDAQSSLTTLSLRLNEAERRHMQLQRICRSCSAQNSVVDGTSVCVSLDCPVLFERAQANQKVRLAGKYLQSKAVAELSQD